LTSYIAETRQVYFSLALTLSPKEIEYKPNCEQCYKRQGTIWCPVFLEIGV
jgi:hypothetical protein